MDKSEQGHVKHFTMIAAGRKGQGRRSGRAYWNEEDQPKSCGTDDPAEVCVSGGALGSGFRNHKKAIRVHIGNGL